MKAGAMPTWKNQGQAAAFCIISEKIRRSTGLFMMKNVLTIIEDFITFAGKNGKPSPVPHPLIKLNPFFEKGAQPAHGAKKSRASRLSGKV